MISLVNNLNDAEDAYVRYLNTVGIPNADMLASVSQFEDYFMVGVYHSNKVVGFIDGFKLTDKVFRLLNAYRGDATALEMYKALHLLEQEVVGKGYDAWYSFTYTKGDLLKRLGAIKWECKQQERG